MHTLSKLWAWLKIATNFDPKSTFLLKQYWRTLEARRSQFESNPSLSNNQILARLQELLSGPPCWASAYSADLLIPALLQGNELDVEFHARLAEAKPDLPDDMAKLYSSYPNLWTTYKTDLEKRALLSEIVRQNLWQFATLDQKRRYRSSATSTCTVIFVSSLIFIFLLFASVDDQRFDLNSWTGSWLIVGLAGWSGASFSWLTKMRDTIHEKDLDVLKDLSRWHYAFSRSFIGMGAAIVLFWALRGGFISGSVFPVLDPIQSQERITKVSAAFRTLAANASCNQGTSVKDREMLLASNVENFRTLLQVHVRERKPAQHLIQMEYLDYSDTDWLLRAGLRTQGQPAGQESYGLTICSNGGEGSSKTWIIRNALLPQPGTLALLLFWSFLAGFSEKLVPSLLDSSSPKVGP